MLLLLLWLLLVVVVVRDRLAAIRTAIAVPSSSTMETEVLQHTHVVRELTGFVIARCNIKKKNTSLNVVNELWQRRGKGSQ